MLHRKLKTRSLRFGHAGPELWRNREWSWGLQKWNENSRLWHWDSSPYWWGKELSLCTCVSVECCAADTKSLQHLLMIASRRKNFRSHWLWNSKFTALRSSSCSIHRQNIFCTWWDLTKIPIPQSQLWAQNVSAFTYSFGRENNNSCTGSWVMKTDGALPVWREFKWCTRDWLVCNMQMQIYPWDITTTKCLTIMLFSPEVISYYGFLPPPSSKASFPEWTGSSPLSPLHCAKANGLAAEGVVASSDLP